MRLIVFDEKKGKGEGLQGFRWVSVRMVIGVFRRRFSQNPP